MNRRNSSPTPCQEPRYESRHRPQPALQDEHMSLQLFDLAVICLWRSTGTRDRREFVLPSAQLPRSHVTTHLRISAYVSKADMRTFGQQLVAGKLSSRMTVSASGGACVFKVQYPSLSHLCLLPLDTWIPTAPYRCRMSSHGCFSTTVWQQLALSVCVLV